MKIINFVLVALMTLSLTQQAAAQKTVLAFVDAEAIIQQMPEYKQIKSELEAYQKQQVKLLQQEEKDLTAYYQEVMAKVQRGELSPQKQQEAETKLQKMQTSLQQKSQNADQTLLKKEKDLSKPMYDKFEAALKKVAEDNNYNYIIDKKFLLNKSGGVDASTKLKKELGIQ